jgi:fucose permease
LLAGTLPALDPAHRLHGDDIVPNVIAADFAAPELAAAQHLSDAARRTPASQTGLLIFFALFAMLYVGVEASLGGWVLSYVHRMPLSHGLFAAAAVSFFWLSLLAGRALAPAVLLRVLERRLLVLSLLVAGSGILFLLASHRATGVIVGSCLAGLGLAPVFPLCVSIFLTISGQSPRTRWLYAVSGAGGAVLPWVTGHVSARTGSLHAGLFVPLLAVLVMLGMLRFGRAFALPAARPPHPRATEERAATEDTKQAAPAVRIHAASGSPSSLGGTPLS